MPRPLATAMALCLLAAALAGCGASMVKITPTYVWSSCRASVNPDCFEQCDRYQALLQEVRYPNVTACRHACNQEFLRQSAQAAGTDCQGAAGAGEDLCKQFCNQNYQ